MQASHDGPVKESGWLFITDPDSDKCVTIATVQCKHCGRHWLWKKGSGRKRGWCTRCNGFTCGNDLCDYCVPQEQLLENIEQGRDLAYRPIAVSSGWDN